MSEFAKKLDIVARGTPRPQPRPRFTGGRVVSTASPLAKSWRDTLASAVKRSLPAVVLWPTGVDLELTFVFSTKDKARHGTPHRHRPDTDNLAKLVMDVFQDAGLLPAGDADVSSLTVRKVWAAPGAEGLFASLSPSAMQAEVPAALAASAGEGPHATGNSLPRRAKRSRVKL